jgi:hypothetical protein
MPQARAGRRDPSRPVTELTAEHLILVTQHQQLNILGQISADQHRQQAPHQPVDQRQQHPAMVAAAALIMQQTPVESTKPCFRAGQDVQLQISARFDDEDDR